MKKYKICFLILFYFSLSEGISIAQPFKWQPLNLPKTCGAYTLLANGQTIFVQTFSNFYRSTDNGNTWITLSGGSNNFLVLALYKSILYAGTYNSLYRSTNNGDTWDSVSSVFPDYSGIRAIIVNGDNIMTAGTNSGVIFSNDGGVTWKKASKGLSNVSTISLGVLGKIFFVGTDHGIYASTDNGSSWSVAGVSLLHMTIPSIAAKDSVLFAATDAGVMGSTDKGNTWTSAGLDGKGIDILSVHNGFIFAGLSKGGLYRSSDNGLTWIPVGLKYSQITSISLDGAHLVAGTTSDGIFQTNDDGNSWTQSGIEPVSVTTLHFDPAGSLYAGTYSNGMYRSTNKGKDWAPIDSGLISTVDKRPVINDLAVFPDVIVAATDQGIYRSNNNGATWTELTTFLLNSSIEAFAMSSAFLFATVSGDDIYSSSDKGVTWVPLHSALPDVGFAPRRLFSSGSKILVLCDSNIYLSTNNGSSWENIWFSKNTDALTFSSDGSTILTGTYFYVVGNDMSDLFGGIGKSGDTGISWENVTGFSGYTTITDFALVGNMIITADAYAGPHRGVYFSTDNGSTWENAGLKNESVYSLYANVKELYAGTYDSVFWTNVTDRVSSVKLPSISIFQISQDLSSNEVTVYYNANNSTRSEISVFNILGNRIFQTTDNNTSLGERQIKFDASKFPQGMYILRLQSGILNTTGKFTIVR